MMKEDYLMELHGLYRKAKDEGKYLVALELLKELCDTKEIKCDDD